MIFFDIETTGFNKKKDQLHGIAILTKEKREYYSYENLQNSHLYDLLESDIPKCGHGILDFDIPFLRQKGYEINGPFIDTRHMAYLLNENESTGLKELTERLFGAEFLSNKRELDRVLAETDSAHVGHLALKDITDETHPYEEIISKYSLEDVANTEMVYEELKKKMDELDLKIKRLFPGQKTPKDLFLQETVPFEAAKLKMQEQGLLINVSRISAARVELAAQVQQLESSLSTECEELQTIISDYYSKLTLEKKLAKMKPESKVARERLEKEKHRWEQPFSWTKANHVQQLLLSLGIPETAFLRTDKGGLCLDKEGLAHLLENAKLSHPAYPVLNLYKDLKKLLKLISTYVGDEEGGGILDFIDPETGRIYPKYGSFTVTGRLTCSEPNVQQLPRNSPVKGFFVPPPGKVFLYFDANQVELRIAAHLSQDGALIEAYNNGEDLHKLTAGILWEDITDERRQVGKTTNFLMIFDGSPRRLQEQLKLSGFNFSEEECRQFKDAFFARWPGYKQYLRDELEKAKRYRAVFTETGRMRRLPDIDLGQYLDYREKRLVNMPSEVYKDLIVNGIKYKQIVAGTTPDANKLFELASKRFSHAKKQAYNSPVQGLGSSIIKRAIIKLTAANYEVVTTVHDMVIVLADELTARVEKAKIEHLLNNCYKLRVPLVWEGKILRSFNEKDKV